MKLNELAVTSPTKQAAKVFESYFGDSINLDVISPKQARMMLSKVQKLVNEHRQTTAFHYSEQNPTYLKLMMMEQVLAAKVTETSTVPVGTAVGAAQNVAQQQSGIAKVNPTVAAGDAANLAKIQQIKDPKLKQVLTKSQSGQSLNPEEQKMVAHSSFVHVSCWYSCWNDSTDNGCNDSSGHSHEYHAVPCDYSFTRYL